MRGKITRLSPNEEARLVQEELQRRRKLRLQQVREQERCIASQVRRGVQARKEEALRNLAATLRSEWQSDKEQKIQALEKLYGDDLRDVGLGHRDARRNEPDRDALALKSEENEERAEERHQRALREVAGRRRSDAERRNRPLEAREKALRTEKERSSRISGLPRPPPNPVESVAIRISPPTKAAEPGRFSVTHHHVAGTTVSAGADLQQAGAGQAAELEARRLDELQSEVARDRLEQLERARLRGDHALRKEKVIQDRARLLSELARLQQADLQRRGRSVSSVPAQMFQPLCRRDDLGAEQQRELEMAFQDLCTEEREVRGHLTLQLESEPLPLPAPSASSPAESGRDRDLDVTLEPADEAETAPGPAHAPPAGGPAGRPALRTLLDRIRAQRDRRGREREGPAIDPEWQQAPGPEDRSADTPTPGSSTVSEGSIQADPIKHPEEHRTEADRQVADDLKRQQEEQLALLEDLMEKQRRLEAELQEAQLDRRRLQQSGTGTKHGRSPEPSPEVKAAAADATHTARLQQYQQRLLHQNRTHRESLEDGRRRLDEYKRALKSRYAVPTAIPPPSPGDTPGGSESPVLHPLGVTHGDPEPSQSHAADATTRPEPTPDPPRPPSEPVPVRDSTPHGLGETRLPAPSVVLERLLRSRSFTPQPEEGDTRTQRDLLLSLLRAGRPHTDTDESLESSVPDPLLKAPHPTSTSLHQTSHRSLPSGPCDPVTGVRLPGPASCPPRIFHFILQDLQQHKLSTIQEVDTPANMTLDTGTEPRPETSLQEDSDDSYAVSLTPPAPASGSALGSGSGSEVSTCRSGRLSWRDMLHLETSAPRVEGRGPPNWSLISNNQTEEDGVSERPDWHASTTLSTGSYSSSDPHDPSCSITDSSSIGELSGWKVRWSPVSPGAGPGVATPQDVVEKYTEEMERSIRSVLSGGTESGPEVHDVTGTFAPLRLESSLEQCPLLDRNAPETTMQDVFLSLAPETTNNDTAECSAAFQIPDTAGSPMDEDASGSDGTGSDRRSFAPPPFSFSTDGRSASAGLSKWEWILRAESSASLPDSRSFCSEARTVPPGQTND